MHPSGTFNQVNLRRTDEKHDAVELRGLSFPAHSWSRFAGAQQDMISKNKRWGYGWRKCIDGRWGLGGAPRQAALSSPSATATNVQTAKWGPALWVRQHSSSALTIRSWDWNSIRCLEREGWPTCVRRKKGWQILYTTQLINIQPVLKSWHNGMGGFSERTYQWKHWLVFFKTTTLWRYFTPQNRCKLSLEVTQM